MFNTAVFAAEIFAVTCCMPCSFRNRIAAT